VSSGRVLSRAPAAAVGFFAVVVAVISDTHLPRGARALPAGCVERLRGSDAILHAGDFVAASVLDELRVLGPPVHAVHGNVDSEELRRLLPATLTVELGAARIGMVHDAGPAAGRLERLRRRFPDADAVVFGHSHVPLHEIGFDAGFQIFNPGSPTDRRRQPRHTMGLAHVHSDGAVAFELVALD
jgi:putative phosphoesterase